MKYYDDVDAASAASDASDDDVSFLLQLLKRTCFELNFIKKKAGK